MLTRSIVRAAAAGLVTAILTAASSGVCNASNTVLSGWDLFTTQPGTAFGGGPWEGIPLGTFDFGGAIGVQNVGSTDTIIHRLDTVVDGSSGNTTALRAEALQLRTVTQTDLGFGLGIYSETLQTQRSAAEITQFGQGTVSTGSMTITFGPEAPPGQDHGTFDATLTIPVDIRLNGTIVTPDTLNLSVSGVGWNHFPYSPDVLLISGVNNLLNGTDQTEDFHTTSFPESITDTLGLTGRHVVRETSFVPEPSTWVMCAMAGLIVPGYVGWRRRQS